MKNDIKVKLIDVSKSYTKKNKTFLKMLDSPIIVFNNISLAIKKGDCVAIVGSNGCGKSTLLKLIIGFELPDKGVINFNNTKIAYIPQDYRKAFFPWLNLRSNLSLNLYGNKIKLFHIELSATDEKLFHDLSVKFDINFDLMKYPYQLSGGEQQIFILIQTILKKPDIVIADEYLSAIDINKKEKIINTLSQWIEESTTTFLFVSHDIQEAIIQSDKIIVLDKNIKGIKKEILINRIQPRLFNWQFEKDFNKYYKKVIECLKS